MLVYQDTLNELCQVNNESYELHHQGNVRYKQRVPKNSDLYLLRVNGRPSTVFFVKNFCILGMMPLGRVTGADEIRKLFTGCVNW